MIKKTSISLLFTSLLLLLSTPAWSRSIISGQVVDADTGKPIENAAVYIYWGKTSGPPGLSYGVKVEVAETLSDGEGFFKIPKYSTLFSHYRMAIYKASYVCWSSRKIFPTYEERKDFRLKDEMVIKLERFREEYSKVAHANFTLGSSIGRNRPGIFDTAINSEEELLMGCAGGNMADSSITRFWDTNNYNGTNPEISTTSPNSIGLAEYTNINFASKNTIFAENFLSDSDVSNDVYYQPYPRKESTNLDEFIVGDLLPETVMGEDNIPSIIYNIRKFGTHGEEIANFVRPTYLTKDIMMESGYDVRIFYRSFKIDDDCARNYAELLIPRAVGYSAGLLDYFFRGRMGIKKAFLQKGENGDITGIEFKIRNTTQLSTGQIEPFSNGNIILAYQYTNPDGSTGFGFEEENVYDPITDAIDPINSQYVPLSVPFTTSIPAGARDLSFTIVYRGTLGNETGAVVARVLPFIYKLGYHYQPGGPDNESNIYTILPDGTGEQQITNASAPNPWYFSPTWSPDGSRLAFEEHFSDPYPYNRNIVVIDLTSDAAYPDNVLITPFISHRLCR